MSMKRQWNNDRNESRLQSFLEVKKYRGGIHGLSHAQRVEKFGLMLAEKTDADRDVIIWFAYLHDSQRTDDGFDFNHGPDAARFVDTIRNAFLQELSDTQISKLKEACRLHTSTHRTWDITIDTCFDADRLDLPRVGNMPDPKRMATEQGAKYAGRSYIENCIDAGCKDLMNTTQLTGISGGTLEFHDKIINTGKGESKFAVRFNEKTDDGKSIGPWTHSKDRKKYITWDLSAKSVSEKECVRGIEPNMCSGIFAVEMDTFNKGRGYAAKIMHTRKDIDLILLEYTEDDVISKDRCEIVLRQCNIVFSCQQPNFIAKYNDGSIFGIMQKFISDKEVSLINTYAKPIRDYREDLQRFISEFGIDTLRFNVSHTMIMRLNVEKDLRMIRLVCSWCAALYNYILDNHITNIPGFLNSLRSRYLSNLTDKEISLIEIILTNEDGKGITQKQNELIIDAGAEGKLFLESFYKGEEAASKLKCIASKICYSEIIEPLRELCKKTASEVVKGYLNGK